MENSVSRLNFLTLYTKLWLPGIVSVWETPVYTLQVHSHSQRDPSSNKNVCAQGGASRKSKEAALKVDWRPRVETHEQAYLGSSASTCVIMIGHVPAVHGWEQASGMHPFAVVLRDSVSLPDNSCHPELVARTALSSDPPTSRCGDERPRSLMGGVHSQRSRVLTLPSHGKTFPTLLMHPLPPLIPTGTC